jgi:hypothetical protein
LVSDDLSIFTLTNVNFIALGTNNPGRLENLTPLITAQDETNYIASFTAGSGHAAADVITLDDDWTTVTVDAVSGGAVTQFTVNSTKGRSATSGTAMAQSSTTGSGTGFDLTPAAGNILGAGTITFVNVGFIDFGDTILSSNDSLTGGRWIGCDQVTTNGATLNNSSFTGYEGTANTSYVIYDVNVDPDGEMDGLSFEKGTAATHAIEFGLNSPTTMTLRDCDFTGYNASDANDDSTFHFKRTTGDVTLNLVNVTGNVSFRTDGANISIVQDPVTLTVNCKDATTKANIQSARVYVKAGSTGPLPFEDSVTITRVSTTASVSHTAHGLSNGQKVFIAGADQSEYNGVKTISNVSANAYDYTVSGSPTTPATGTITSTAVIISGTTDASGNITDTRTYASNQSIDGVSKAAKSSPGDDPKYKPSAIGGTINSGSGLTVNLLMIRDQ